MSPEAGATRPPTLAPARPARGRSGGPEEIVPGKPLPGSPLGFPRGPEDLLLEADGRPVRIDKAFSWDAPLAVHGMLQTVIANAWRGDPYPVEVLFLYMANMAWNSAMNPGETMRMLADKDPATGEYRIPRFIYADAYRSETVAYADLVLPDTTYLERWDCISLLDRPIGTAHGPGDAIRQPVVAPDRDVRPFQEVLIDLGVRLKLPAFAHPDGEPRYPGGYPDYLVHHQRKPGIGPLAGWRGTKGDEEGRGAPNDRQLEAYIANGCFWHFDLAPEESYLKPINRAYLARARELGLLDTAAPITLHLYAEVLQRFRLAAEGHGAAQPPDSHRERIRTHFDPLPFWYRPFEQVAFADADFPLHAITQRPMPMYHSWGSQNAWLRQILARNFLYMNRRTGAELGLADGDWVEITSPHGRTRAQLRLMDGLRGEHGLDLERHRQAGRRLGPGAGCARGRARLPAQPRHRRAAARGTRLQPRQRRPDHRAGRVVRPARPGPQGWRTARRMIEPAHPGRSSRTPRMTEYAPVEPGPEAARAGHRPRHLRRLPCLRDRLQVLERPGPSRPAGGPGALRRRAGRRLAQPRPQLRGGRGGLRPHRPLPPLLPALRRARLRHRLPDRGFLQAHRGRHRAGERRAVHRLRPVRLGLPLRCPRARPGRACHAQMHPVHRPHLQHPAARGRAAAGLRHGLPDPCPSFRRSGRPDVRRLAAGGRARRRRRCCPSWATGR